MTGKAPEPLLLEAWNESALGEPDGFRILQDGTWWTYGTTETVLDPATHKVVSRSGPRKWRREEPRLSEGDLARLKEAVRSAGVLGTSSSKRRGPGVVDGARARWTFALGGRTTRFSWMTDMDPVPGAVNRLRHLADDLVFRAQQRWLRDHGLEHTPVD